MTGKGRRQPRLWKRDECIEAANRLLAEFAPEVPRVENIGRALLVLVLHEARQNIDYREHEERWVAIRKGSSYTKSDILPITIVATESGAVTITHSPESTTPIDEMIQTLDLLWLGDPSERVQLRKPGEPVRINMVEHPPITQAQHNVVVTLLRVGGNGLTEAELVKKSGHGDARGILSRLKKLPGWDEAIYFPGRPAGRYRILS